MISWLFPRNTTWINSCIKKVSILHLKHFLKLWKYHFSPDYGELSLDISVIIPSRCRLVGQLCRGGKSCQGSVVLFSHWLKKTIQVNNRVQHHECFPAETVWESTPISLHTSDFKRDCATCSIIQYESTLKSRISLEEAFLKSDKITLKVSLLWNVLQPKSEYG